MLALVSDGARQWEPSGFAEPDRGAASGRDGARAAAGAPRGADPGAAGRWLRGAAVVLALLAAVAAAVSWQAQYVLVLSVKHARAIAALEAGIPDAGAVIFAALGVALALHGKRALRPRVLNAACIGISLAMNALAAARGWRDLAIWVMPAGVYALASDTLISVVRASVLARQRADGRALADDGSDLLAALGGVTLWLLRLVLAGPSTLRGFRAWVIEECPVAPGRKAPLLSCLPQRRRGRWRRHPPGRAGGVTTASRRSGTASSPWQASGAIWRRCHRRGIEAGHGPGRRDRLQLWNREAGAGQARPRASVRLCEWRTGPARGESRWLTGVASHPGPAQAGAASHPGPAEGRLRPLPRSWPVCCSCDGCLA